MPTVRDHILPRHPILPDHIKGSMRPIWRGRLHAITFLAAIPALIWLIIYSPSSERLAVTVYAVSLLAVLGTSSAYHILTRTPTSQTVMSRIDRAMIYVLIAGTYTPIVPIIIPTPYSVLLLAGIWAGATIGIILRATGRAPKTSVALYIALGWVALLTAPALWSQSPLAMILIALGGVAYTVGVGFYATKRPHLSLTHFGHHELFHAFTIVGFISHFAAIAVLLSTISG